MAATGAAKNRKMRQDSTREMLKNKGLIQHVLEISKDLAERGATMQPTEIQAKKAAADIQLKLINKYLPDLKATEITGADGEPIKTDNRFVIEIVSAK